jgi:predicted tellurium resistance membrane protein TerC
VVFLLHHRHWPLLLLVPWIDHRRFRYHQFVTATWWWCHPSSRRIKQTRRSATYLYFQRRPQQHQSASEQQQQQAQQRITTTVTSSSTSSTATNAKSTSSSSSSDNSTTAAAAAAAAAVVIDEETIRNDLIRTGGWVAAAVAFGLYLGQTQGSVVAEEFFAGYLIEQSLSVDNLFVFLLLFESFGVRAGPAQQKVLTYGIAGAVVMRTVMIALGAAALQRFRGILLVFAAILLYSSYNLLFKAEDGEDDEPGTNAIITFSQKLMDTTDTYDGDNFFSTIENGKPTPLLVCMIAVELSDIVFAVDSIPAVFGVTEVSILGLVG